MSDKDAANAAIREIIRFNFTHVNNHDLQYAHSLLTPLVGAYASLEAENTKLKSELSDFKTLCVQEGIDHSLLSKYIKLRQFTDRFQVEYYLKNSTSGLSELYHDIVEYEMGKIKKQESNLS